MDYLSDEVEFAMKAVAFTRDTNDAVDWDTRIDLEKVSGAVWDATYTATWAVMDDVLAHRG